MQEEEHDHARRSRAITQPSSQGPDNEGAALNNLGNHQKKPTVPRSLLPLRLGENTASASSSPSPNTL